METGRGTTAPAFAGVLRKCSRARRLGGPSLQFPAWHASRFSPFCAKGEPWPFAPQPHMHIVRFLESMKRIGLIALAGVCFSFGSGQLAAQSDDPNESFLKAYMTAQQAEKLEHDNEFQAALAKFRIAGNLLEDLRKNHGDWQPAVVDFRARKISESIVRIQGKVGTQKELTEVSSSPSAASTDPVLPDKSGPPEPSVEIAPAKPIEKPAPTASAEVFSSVVREAAIKDATKRLQDKVDQLESELQKTQTQYDTVAKEKENLNDRLAETNSKLEKAQAEVDRTHGAEEEVRGQLAQAEEALKNISASANDTKGQEALKAQIAQLKKALANAEEGRAAAEKEKKAATEKLTDAKTEIASATREKNALLEDLKSGKQAQERVKALTAENSDLKDKLATAEKKVREISADKPKKEKEMADVKRQVEQLRDALASSQNQNKAYQATVAELRAQLEE